MENKSYSESTPLTQKLIVGCSCFALNPLYAIISSFLTFFYTDVIGVNMAAVGTIILLSKVFDGLSDVAAGVIIDRTKSKYGHARPWLLRMALPVALSYPLLFAVPEVGEFGQLVYIFISYNVVNTVVYTMLDIAYNSLPTFISRNQIDRSSFYAIGMFFAGFTNMSVSMFMLKVIALFGDGQAAWLKAGALIGVIGALILVFVFMNTSESVTEIQREKKTSSFKQDLIALLHNKYWFIVFAIQFCIVLHQFSTLTVGVYYAKYILNDAFLVGKLIMFHNLPGIFASAFILPNLMKRLPKRTIGIMCTCILITGQLLALFGKTGTVIMVSMVIRGAGFGMIMGSVNGMLADTIEYSEWNSHVRPQALSFAANSVAKKVGSGVGTFLMGAYLTYAGYDGLAAVQSETACKAISNVFTVAPLIVYIIMLALFSIYALDKIYPQIIADLKKRTA